jgi:uncharacterized protein (TIGR04255 family)
VYEKPPIVEAVIELRFSQPFDAKALAHELQAKLGDEYAGALQPVDQIEVETSFEGEGFSTSTRKKIKTWFIRSKDTRSIVGCGEGVLSVHEVAPYRGWSALRAMFDRLVTLVPEAVTHTVLSFVGVRYIDRIVLPKDGGALDEYFTALPKVPATMPSAVSTFHWSVTTEPDQDGTEAALTIASTQPEPDGRPAVVLDLTLHQRNLAQPTLASGAIVPILERLHVAHRSVFEESITPKTRELFR